MLEYGKLQRGDNNSFLFLTITITYTYNTPIKLQEWIKNKEIWSQANNEIET